MVVVVIVVVIVAVGDGSVAVDDVSVVVVVDDRSVAVDDVSLVGNGVVESNVVVIVVVVVVSGFDGERITNFNSRERVTAIIAKMIKEMEMIQRHCRRLSLS